MRSCPRWSGCQCRGLGIVSPPIHNHPLAFPPSTSVLRTSFLATASIDGLSSHIWTNNKKGFKRVSTWLSSQHHVLHKHAFTPALLPLSLLHPSLSCSRDWGPPSSTRVLLDLSPLTPSRPVHLYQQSPFSIPTRRLSHVALRGLLLCLWPWCDFLCVSQPAPGV